jgi:simple sugar transport system permease protein
VASTLLTSFLLTSDFWDSTVRVTGPIALAAIACVICSRAGVLFIGIEGVMLISCFFSIAGAVWTGSIALGIVIAMVAGVLSSLLFGALSMLLRMGDVVGGLVVHVGAIGLTAFLVEEWFPNGATIGAQSLTAIWGSTGNGGLDVVFHQQPLVYVAVLSAIGVTLFLRTRWGLVVRSSGESMRVAQSFGVELIRLRFLVLAAAGVFAGLAGATIGLAIVGTFDVNVVSGRGFIGLACVMLGAWMPLGALLAATLFGLAYAIQFRVEALGQWIQLFPYVVTLIAIALLWGRTQGPAEEGRGLPEEAR